MRSRMRRKKRPLDYLLPFLVLASVVIIGVLGFQMVASWGKDKKGDVYFYTVEGNSRILPYSQKDWDDASNGIKLLLGDSLKTSAQGRGVLQFFNGTIMRLGDDTAITLMDLNKTNDSELIAVQLQHGNLWVNGDKSNNIKEATYRIRSPHLLVEAKGTIFTVESNDDVESVKVFDGEVTVDVIVTEDGKEQVLDSFEVLPNQQFTLDDVGLEAIQNNRDISLLSSISQSLLSSEWYSWNREEDESPSDFSVMEPSTSQDDTKDSSDTDEDDTPGSTDGSDDETTDEAQSDENTQSSANTTPDPTKPVILQPTFTTTTLNKFTLSGTVPAGTEKVIVDTIIAGQTQSYTLSRFKAGDTTWQYNVAESLGNLKKGANTYNVYAVNAEGIKSAPAVLTVSYGNTATDRQEDSDVDISADLTAPGVTTFNGSSSSVTTQNTVKVSGTVQGAAKVVVNGYTLQQFTPGATTWSYTARESLGNLKPGTNTYTVYALDEDGNKSEVTTFTITYNKPQVTTPPASTPTPTSSQPSPTPTQPSTPTPTPEPQPVG